MANSKDLMQINVLSDVMTERHRQDCLWGEQTHDLRTWLMILAEEFGEVAKATNEWFFRDGPQKDIRDELIQVAALCVAMVESLDRNGK